MGTDQGKGSGLRTKIESRHQDIKTKIDGCMGITGLVGGVLLRIAMKAVLTTISKTTTTAKAAIVLHDLGLPAIIGADQMPICPSRFRIHSFAGLRSA
jgi:hypothetical protein